MSKASHTPGPWHIPHFADNTSTCNCKSIVDEGYAGGICTIHVGNGLLVGGGGNDAPPIEEAKSNAHLISASPDMLLALRPFVSIASAILREAPANADNFSIFQDCAGHAHRVTMDELRAVVAAVAKAEGGAA